MTRLSSAAAVLLLLTAAASAGPLAPPPGPVGSSMTTLQQVEPRTPITAQTCPGNASSLRVISAPGNYYLTEDLALDSNLHGIAVNVGCDLTPFTWFTPCGIADAEVTSLARELGIEDAPADELARLFADVEQRIADNIAERFGLVHVTTDAAALHALAAEHPVDEPQLALPGEPRRRQATRLAIGAAS